MIIKGEPRRKKTLKLRMLLFLGLAMLLLSSLLYLVDKKVKQHGFGGLSTFASRVPANFIKGLSANPTEATLIIPPASWNNLERKRQDALERGLIVNEGDNFVPATLKVNGKELNVELRLKGHMTDHIQGNKWSFRVKVKDKRGFLGMKLFSLQHPGTRGYLSEWIFHRLMKDQGIISLRYDFISLTINGEEKGIYAVEENFDQEILEHNQRPPGPIMRFNPELYWSERLDEIKGQKVVSEYYTFEASNLEPFRKRKTLESKGLYGSFTKARQMMARFLNNSASAAEVFDMERMARYMAIVDLVGGHHSIDWTDIKLYYNPVSEKLEPVAYESFTLLPAKTLSGSYVFAERADREAAFHKLLFSDTTFYKIYVKELEHVSDKKFLDRFFSQNQEELAEKQKIIFSDYPHRVFDSQLYYRNQAVIRKLMNAPRSLNVFVRKDKDSSLILQVGSIDVVPVEIVAVVASGDTLPMKQKVIIPPKQRGRRVEYRDVETGIKTSSPDVKILYRLPGGSRLKELEAFPYPSESYATAAEEKGPADLKALPFLSINESKKLITFAPGVTTLKAPLIIPAGYTVSVPAGAKINLVSKATITSYSPIIILGTEVDHVSISSSDETGGGLKLLSKEANTFRHCDFYSLAPGSGSSFLLFYETSCSFNNCTFSGGLAENFISILRSSFKIQNTSFAGSSDDALDLKFSDGTVSECFFTNIGEDCIDATGSTVEIYRALMDSVKNKAINSKAKSTITLNDVKISNASVALSIEDLSSAAGTNISIDQCIAGIAAYNNKPEYDGASGKFTSVRIKRTRRAVLVEERSSLSVNRKEIKRKLKNVERIIDDIQR